MKTENAERIPVDSIPSNFELIVTFSPSGWIMKRNEPVTVIINAQSAFKITGLVDRTSLELGQSDRYKIINLLMLANPESIPSGRQMTIASDAGHQQIDLTWGEIKRNWEANNSWDSPHLEKLSKLIFKLAKIQWV